MRPKRWCLLTADRLITERLSRDLRVHPAIAALLATRGIRTAEMARRFLRSALSDLHEPEDLPGVEEAAERLHAAVRAGRRICVYGDYDVDGMTATTLLWRCLRLAGADVDFYVPHRLEEGYGLNVDALRQIRRQGTHVVVTVDCGITAVAEAEEARALGLELIITDHHEFHSELPDADVLVHPRLPGSAYPFPHLSGAGVAFKLAWAVARRFSQARKVTEAFRQFLLESLSLVALGTVADSAPVLDENRIFIRHGLQTLLQAPSVGLRALIEASRLSQRPLLSAEDLAYELVPRLNAVGRLEQARLAVELLAATHPQRAQDLARYCATQNDIRRKLELRMLHQARELVETHPQWLEDNALVLAHPDWHPGLVGVMANRLLERYGKAVAVISLRQQPATGSIRCPAGFHAKEVLQSCSDLLETFGGHAAAAGFRIRAELIEDFRQRLQELAALSPLSEAQESALIIDTELPLAAVTPGLLKILDALQPFGPGNRKPLFLATHLNVVGEPRTVGEDQRHLMFRVRQDEGRVFRVIGFNLGERLPELLTAQGQCSIVFHPRRDTWQGQERLDLQILDLQPTSEPMIEWVDADEYLAPECR
ncbi:MAG: single-stranded-DNA-specific exonuclease RecJ [Gemmatales bacterium]|nr:single-stranded-DNA-specific exonuclease RecJ [Gemmatales bacterium]MDW8222636.1 single-stranded-DNA-specific exonuclease RecJ [Gemmatales bacterium]